MARDGVLVLDFEEALDPRGLVERVQVSLTRAGQTIPASGVRVLADPNHGRALDFDGDGAREWAPERILVDLAVDEFESLTSAVPLEISAGLPAGVLATVALAPAAAPTAVGPASAAVRSSGVAFTTQSGPEGLFGGSGAPLVIGIRP